MTKNEAYLLSCNARPRTSGIVACMIVAASAIVLAAFLSFTSFSGAQLAFADDPEDQTTKTAYELQQEIEAAQADYAAALEEVNAANAAIEENRKRIEQLEAEIPAQQQRSAKATREQYKLQQQGVGIVELLLSANDLGDFLRELEYIMQISDANVAEMNRLSQMKAEVEASQAQMQTKYREARERADKADEALTSLQEAQAEVQRRIEEEARLAAEIARQAEQNAEAPRDNDQGSVNDAGSDNGGAADNGSSDESGSANAGGGQTAVNAPDPNMSADEASFVAEWAPRIDAYLSGSPLAGQGTTFARAAYQYGVDPRWSPAISFTESSKGEYCFLPYNAWGWGSESWSSWEEAIFDHVGGLSRGYGYTISEEAARKYCPPNWQTWYERTLAQMNQI